ncbi:MAG: hypothetical protein ACYTG0_10005, partial [Planctomycetota bacterium]
MKDPDTPDNLLKLAYARFQVDQANEIQIQKAAQATGNDTPMMEICRKYLDDCQRNKSASTYRTRHDFLVDFCTGAPPRADNRIHPGFGEVRVGDLTPDHVQTWLDAHPTWGGST